jgi:hypothetical protein
VTKVSEQTIEVKHKSPNLIASSHSGHYHFTTLTMEHIKFVSDNVLRRILCSAKTPEDARAARSLSKVLLLPPGFPLAFYDLAELIEEHPIIEGLVENYLWATRGRLTYPWGDLRRMLTLAEDDKERKLSDWIRTCFIDFKNTDTWVTLPRFVINQPSFLRLLLRYDDHISEVERRTFPIQIFREILDATLALREEIVAESCRQILPENESWVTLPKPVFESPDFQAMVARAHGIREMCSFDRKELQAMIRAAQGTYLGPYAKQLRKSLPPGPGKVIVLPQEAAAFSDAFEELQEFYREQRNHNGGLAVLLTPDLSDDYRRMKWYDIMRSQHGMNVTWFLMGDSIKFLHNVENGEVITDRAFTKRTGIQLPSRMMLDSYRAHLSYAQRVFFEDND